MIVEIGTADKDAAARFCHAMKEHLRRNEALTITDCADDGVHGQRTRMVMAAVPTKDRRMYVWGMFDGWMMANRI